ncbi:MAG: phosphoserine phosphatase SerB [Streptomycetaceae bacterium]|nr:MAG: phosphoserine phosphatase SerB [Streptomycetaceae bacterium]
MATNEQFTGLILLSGVDKPGINDALFSALAPFAITVLDIEQVVISNRLILTVLIACNPAHEKAIDTDLLTCASELDVDIATLFASTTHDSFASKKGLIHIVVLSAKLAPVSIAAISGAISKLGANIERISRTASTPVTAIEMIVSGTDHERLTTALAPIAAANHVDIAVQPNGFSRFSRKLVQLDVDSTLIQQEVIDLLADKAGVGAEVKSITESAMRGELDFAQSLTARVALLKGLSESALIEVQADILLTPGAKTLIKRLHKLGHSVAVVSGGFINVIQPLLASLEIKHLKANTLEVVDGVLTGALLGPIIDRAAKADALREFAAIESISMSQTVAIGDGANDLDMIAAAGLGIAFNAKPAVKAAADSSLSDPYLDSVLYLLGIPREDIED